MPEAHPQPRQWPTGQATPPTGRSAPTLPGARLVRHASWTISLPSERVWRCGHAANDLVNRQLHFTAGPLAITANIPEAVARPLVGLKRWTQLHRPKPGGSSPLGRLVMAEHAPPLHLEQRCPDDALPFFRRTTPPAPPTSARADPTGAVPTRQIVDLQRAVERLFWYHTIELPEGIVTPGVFDHRPLVKHYGLPTTLKGKRALDVATFDGFWAFELERRGAEVVAIDVPRLSACDFPPAVREALTRECVNPRTGEGFQTAHRALGSQVRRVEQSVYDLDPSDIGTFDFVHVADLLVHLENPLAALRAIRSVTSGTALVADCFNRHLKGNLTEYHGGWTGLTWWVPSLDTLAQMIIDAGFADVKVHLVYSLPFVDELVGPWRVAFVATT